ncbi:hypothetical protein ACJO1P_03905 [Vibrio parahaemolyticus]|uniref:hypothetical protein n=1 Tax=Vibrio parahaemolyticus TaxID=670 RepID=UPI001E40ECBC|nr:hypothetical protein [Vibrio parahaemolyticus]MCI4895375.1 hypothetical protein [Vibrio parahaemolyticus]MDG2759034.1 hypothetical protein [Vibrio parahaemolyticus]
MINIVKKLLRCPSYIAFYACVLYSLYLGGQWAIGNDSVVYQASETVLIHILIVFVFIFADVLGLGDLFFVRDEKAKPRDMKNEEGLQFGILLFYSLIFIPIGLLFVTDSLEPTKESGVGSLVKISDVKDVSKGRNPRQLITIDGTEYLVSGRNIGENDEYIRVKKAQSNDGKYIRNFACNLSGKCGSYIKYADHVWYKQKI